MSRYIIEIWNWTTWDFESSFDDEHEANEFAASRYPQNKWRIVDRDLNNEVVFEFDPFESFKEQASSEVLRLDIARKWNENRIVNEQRMRRLNRIAQIQRNSSYVNFSKIDTTIDWIREGF